jgi:sarcosine oxidase subunit beta
MKLWEGLEQDLNYNLMLSQRGVIMLYHSDAQRDAYVRRGNAMWMEGVAAELIEREQLKKMIPFLNYDHARYPILGGLLQRRAGTARHDAVAWGYARGADRHGVDIIEHCEVTGIRRENGVVTGVETTKGFIGCGKLALAAAGNSSRVGEMADLKLPLESHVLQAFVTEGLKPCIDHVIVYGGGHFYISQSDKGGLVFGAEIDGYSSYAQRGNLATAEHVMEEGVTMIPGLSRVRVLRAWGGVMDMSMDGSPIIDRTSIDNLYLNCGWCYGGFKATPASGYCFAHLIAKNDTHPVARALRLDRFARGYAVDEAGAGPQPNLH